MVRRSCRAREVQVLVFAAICFFLDTSIGLVRGQTNDNGFISIDCGIAVAENYINATTKLPYISDEKTIDMGTSYKVAAEYLSGFEKPLITLRSFPEGVRNCYTLTPLKAGPKFLITAMFLYGNYDGQNKLPIFDLYVDTNFWTTVNITQVDHSYGKEIMTVVQRDHVNICLVNTGHGIPFISELRLRPIKNTLYPMVTETQSLNLFGRTNIGASKTTTVRYPDDPYDRVWKPWPTARPDWTPISTTSTVSNVPDDRFEVPSLVMQTAVIPLNTSMIDIYWDPIPTPRDPNPGYLIVVYFSEFQKLTGKMIREFNIYLDDNLSSNAPIAPDYLYSDPTYSKSPLTGTKTHNFSIIPTTKSTLPPVLNAYELYSVLPTSQDTTDGSDVTAIAAIKTFYGMKGFWAGDPCLPKEFSWDGLNCSYPNSKPPRITTINLSSRGLSGTISTSFANLTALEYLDLSQNHLTGQIPEVLSRLSSLKLLDLTGNNITGPIPAGLLQISQSGSLTLRIDNPPPAPPSPSPTKNDKLLVKVLAPFAAVLLLLLVSVGFLWCRITRKREDGTPARPNTTALDDGSGLHRIHDNRPVIMSKHQFTRKEVQTITNNFRTSIGVGGFGKVYKGSLEDGTPVAVKKATVLSSHGLKGFKSEAEHLMKVYHKNLVSLIGYCNDRDCLALIYEYMLHGNLLDHLRVDCPNRPPFTCNSTRPLFWGERVRVAYESAQGLEYLHALCTPPIIHRDVKTSNILLTANWEAKIADFGLSKSPQDNSKSHLTTFSVAGTPGYIDPEYHATGRVTVKSDVYSFGVVLFEIITGKPAVLSFSLTEKTPLVYWVRTRLAKGDVESIVDKGMPGRYDINSVWKVADIANKCTAELSVQRPTMTEVVMQLKDCMELVSASGYGCSDDFSAESNDAVEGNMGRQFQTTVSFDTGPSAR